MGCTVKKKKCQILNALVYTHVILIAMTNFLWATFDKVNFNLTN